MPLYACNSADKFNVCKECKVAIPHEHTENCFKIRDCFLNNLVSVEVKCEEINRD